MQPNLLFLSDFATGTAGAGLYLIRHQHHHPDDIATFAELLDFTEVAPKSSDRPICESARFPPRSHNPRRRCLWGAHCPHSRPTRPRRAAASELRAAGSSDAPPGRRSWDPRAQAGTAGFVAHVWEGARRRTQSQRPQRMPDRSEALQAL